MLLWIMRCILKLWGSFLFLHWKGSYYSWFILHHFEGDKIVQLFVKETHSDRITGQRVVNQICQIHKLIIQCNLWITSSKYWFIHKFDMTLLLFFEYNNKTQVTVHHWTKLSKWNSSNVFYLNLDFGGNSVSFLSVLWLQHIWAAIDCSCLSRYMNCTVSKNIRN